MSSRKNQDKRIVDPHRKKCDLIVLLITITVTVGHFQPEE